LQTKEALLKILGDMRPEDYFDLVLFGSQVQLWRGSLAQASEANLQAARGFVKRFSVAGGKDRHLRPPDILFSTGIWAYIGLISLFYSHKPEWRFAPAN
jgi:hypothetical protein